MRVLGVVWAFEPSHSSNCESSLGCSAEGRNSGEKHMVCDIFGVFQQSISKKKSKI